MNISKRLVINSTPLTGYMEDAYSLTAAVAKECSYEWIYSNYIQLVFQDPERFDNQPVKFFKVSWKSGLIWDADCPLLICDTISRELMMENKIDIINFICNAIDKDQYVKVYLDEFYLPYRSSYQWRHLIHESLFFGYDNEKKQLYGLAYITDANGYGFKEFSVDMNNVKQAFERVPIMDSVQKNRIMCMSCNWEKFYEFDLQEVKETIYEYLHSFHTDLKFVSINNANSYYVFGLEIYEKIINYYMTEECERTVIPLHIIYEHKRLMYDRLKYMMENEYITKDEVLLNQYLKIVKEAYLCKFLYIKWSIKNNVTGNGKFKDKITNLKNQDELLMKQIYQKIEDKETFNENYIYSRWGACFDIAYMLERHIYNRIHVKFKLHIINDKTNGYIYFSQKRRLSHYYAPKKIGFSAGNKQFYIGGDDEKSVVQGMECLVHHIYDIDISIDLTRNSYNISIQNGEKKCCYRGNYWREEDVPISYVDCMVAIHDNSYRYKISNLLYQ